MNSGENFVPLSLRPGLSTHILPNEEVEKIVDRIDGRERDALKLHMMASEKKAFFDGQNIVPHDPPDDVIDKALGENWKLYEGALERKNAFIAGWRASRILRPATAGHDALIDLARQTHNLTACNCGDIYRCEGTCTHSLAAKVLRDEGILS